MLDPAVSLTVTDQLIALMHLLQTRQSIRDLKALTISQAYFQIVRQQNLAK